MNIDARHKLLREKLDSLGFTQPLPIGSLAIVSALLDDLVLGTKKLKEAKQTNASLEQVSCLVGFSLRLLSFGHTLYVYE